MIESFLTGFAITVIALFAMVIPFILKSSDEPLFDATDVERISGPRNARTIITAAILLVIFTLGAYAAFSLASQDRYLVGWIGSFVFVLMLAVIFPKGRFRDACLQFLKLHLIATAFIFIFFGVYHLWIAASEEKALLPSRRIFSSGRLWVMLAKEPGWFWLSVISSGIGVFVITAILRQHFMSVRRPAASNSQLNADARQETPRAG